MSSEEQNMISRKVEEKAAGRARPSLSRSEGVKERRSASRVRVEGCWEVKLVLPFFSTSAMPPDLSGGRVMLMLVLWFARGSGSVVDIPGEGEVMTLLGP